MSGWWRVARLARLPSLPRLVEAALLVGIVLVPWLGWQRLSEPPRMAHTLSSQQAPRLPGLQDVLGHALFGRLQAQPHGATRQQHIAASPLKLKLLGVVRAGARSAAIVLHEGRQQVIRIGETIAPGARLARVEAHAIIVERGGRLERIALPAPTLKAAAPGYAKREEGAR